MPGTFDHLIREYRASSDYKTLEPGTRKDYNTYLDILRHKHGHRSIALMPRDAVLKMRDEYQATPRKANYLLAVLRAIQSVLRVLLKAGGQNAPQPVWKKAAAAAGQSVYAEYLATHFKGLSPALFNSVTREYSRSMTQDERTLLEQIAVHERLRHEREHAWRYDEDVEGPEDWDVDLDSFLEQGRRHLDRLLGLLRGALRISVDREVRDARRAPGEDDGRPATSR